MSETPGSGTLPRARLAIVVALLLAAWLAWRLWPSEERRVEAKVREAGAAVEAESLLTLAGCISRDYADGQGRSYEMVLGAAKGLVFDRYDELAISFRSCKVTVSGTKATAAISVQARGKPAGGTSGALEALFGDRELLDFVIGLRKGSDGWKIVSIDESDTL